MSRLVSVIIRDEAGCLYTAANVVSQESVGDNYGFNPRGHVSATIGGIEPISYEAAAARLGFSSPEGVSKLRKDLDDERRRAENLEKLKAKYSTVLDASQEVVANQHAELVEKNRELQSLQGHVPNTMTAQATTPPVVAPILPGIGDMLKQAGKAAAGATVLSIVTKTASEAAPAVLTAVAQRTPYIKNITGVTQVLQMAQLSAVMTVAQDTVDALFESVKPAFQAIASVIDTDAIEAPPEEA